MGFETVSVCDGLQALQELRRYVFATCMQADRACQTTMLHGQGRAAWGQHPDCRTHWHTLNLSSCNSMVECQNSCLRRNTHQVCLVLLDLQMPVLDGWSTARLLRQEHGMALPILACTASDLTSPAGGSSVQQHALDCGADLCLSKPLGVSQLTAALQQLQVWPLYSASAPTAALASCPAVVPTAAAAAQEHVRGRAASAPCSSQHSKELPTLTVSTAALPVGPSTSC
jgi:CheY-like chemotaxis protein